ncbi:unnamed protein product [Prunus armeniaca]
METCPWACPGWWDPGLARAGSGALELFWAIWGGLLPDSVPAVEVLLEAHSSESCFNIILQAL